MLIDSHCHLTFPELLERLPAVRQRARAAGVQCLVSIATEAADAETALAELRDCPEVALSLGVHPHAAGRAAGDLTRLADWLRTPPSGWEQRLVALGETGLDYHYDFAPRAAQIDLFHAHLELAGELDLPVVIHAREAERDALALLREHPAVTQAVFHCYTGSVADADTILDAGYWISVTGIVTFKNAGDVRAVAERIPADRLMLETDSPYLSPVPVRNQRPCEPAFVAHTARFLAELRGTSLEALAAQTTANARRFYALPEE